MIYRNITLPVFSRIGKGLISNLSDIIKEENFFFRRVSILTGNYGGKLIEDYKIKKHFEKVFVFNIRKVKNLSSVKSEVLEKKTELLLSIGGGEVNDIAKYISMETSIPLISIPMTLSNDGISSPISILRVNGSYKSLGTTPPIGIIGDIKVLKRTPEIYLLSGLGDLMSNLSAVLDWELANRNTGEKIDNFAKNISLNSALSILYNFQKEKYKTPKEEDFLKDLFDGLVSSGVSMIIAKSSRPASGSEHNISHALDRSSSKTLHGIQVGFATVFTLFLHKQYLLLDDLIKLYKTFKFPLTFKDLGIKEEIFLKSLKTAPLIRDRYTVLNLFTCDELPEIFKDFYKEIY